MKPAMHYAGYYGSIMVPIACAASFVAFMPESTQHDAVLTSAKAFWFTGVVFAATNAIGLLYGSPWHKEKKAEQRWVGWNCTKHLVVAYVSRGNNAEALRRAIGASRSVLDGMGVSYVIEAVTDIPVDAGADTHYVVPVDYQTKRRAKYKARALHYAAEQRTAKRHTWVLHLDEESVITPEAIRGINEFLWNARPSTIGQGEIKYNAHNYGRNILITATDAIRTGDDLGRFRLQYKLFRKPLFGMHGSFFLVNSLLERKVGFDLGGNGSITEDAYFALVCSDMGVRFDWIDGFIREQSPFTLTELLKQRRRWITGLCLLTNDKAISRKQRLALTANMLLWRLAWVGPVVTLWNIASGGSVIPGWVAVIAAALSGVIGVVYSVGAYRNATGIKMGRVKQLAIWGSALLLVPASCAIEGVAVLYSIVRPVRVFEVVNK